MSQEGEMWILSKNLKYRFLRDLQDMSQVHNNVGLKVLGLVRETMHFLRIYHFANIIINLS